LFAISLLLLIPFKVGGYGLSAENNFLADGNQGDCALKAGHPDAWIKLVGVVADYIDLAESNLVARLNQLDTNVPIIV
jgi:hypothetical protein